MAIALLKLETSKTRSWMNDSAFHGKSKLQVEKLHFVDLELLIYMHGTQIESFNNLPHQNSQFVCHSFGACWTWIGSDDGWNGVGCTWEDFVLVSFIVFGERKTQSAYRTCCWQFSQHSRNIDPTIELLESEPLHWFTLNPIELKFFSVCSSKQQLLPYTKNASSTLLEWIVFAMGLKDILSKELWPNTQQPQKQMPSFWVGLMIQCSFCFERQENSMQIIACVWNAARMCKMLDWFWTLTWTPLALWQWWSLLANASKLWEPWWGTALRKV